MAQPVLLELPRHDPREALYERLKTAPQEHAEALLNVYEILQELQDRGVLEMAKGALGSSEKLLEILVNVANTPKMIRGIRNMMIWPRSPILSSRNSSRALNKECRKDWLKLETQSQSGCGNWPSSY
jgi:hypothetical protein